MATWIEHARYTICAKYINRFGAGSSEIDHDNFAEQIDGLLRFADDGQYSIAGVIPIVATIAWSTTGMTRNDTTGAHVLLERRVEIPQEEFTRRKRRQQLKQHDAALRQKEERIRKGALLTGMMHRFGLDEEDLQAFMTSDRFLRKEWGLLGTKHFLGTRDYPSREAARRELETCRAAIAGEYHALLRIREERAACARELSELEGPVPAEETTPSPEGAGNDASPAHAMRQP